MDTIVNYKMSRKDVAEKAWEDMRVIYRKMGLSEEEIAERILCKTTKVIERKGNLDECDK
jgi:hypothetical protein